MDYGFRNTILIRTLFFSIRIFGFFANFNYFMREYFSFFSLQNFINVVLNLVIDIGTYTISFITQDQTEREYLSFNKLRRFYSFYIGVSYLICNIIINLYLYLANIVYNSSFCLYNPNYDVNEVNYIDSYYIDNIFSLCNDLVNSFWRPMIQRNEHNIETSQFLSFEDIRIFLNFVMYFNLIYPILTYSIVDHDDTIPNNDSDSLNKNTVIPGEKINTPNNLICSICFENSCDWSLPCKHQYHFNCIEKWYKKMNKKSCPYCRCESFKVN